MRIRSVQTEVKTMKLSEEGVAPMDATDGGRGGLLAALSSHITTE